MENKNTLIGTLLLGLLIFGLFYYTNQFKKPASPTAKADTTQTQSAPKSDNAVAIPSVNDSNTVATAPSAVDSVAALGQLGPFAAAANGTDKEYVIENELQKITISSRGGAIKSVQLKKYTTWDKKPLYLFTDKTQQFSYQFVIAGNKIVNTKNLYFEPIGESFEVKGTEQKTITFRLKAEDGQYFEQKYTLKGDDYQVGYDVNVVGLDKIIPNNNDIQLTWTNTLQNLEHSVVTERRYSALYYKYGNGDVAHLDEDKPNQQEALTGKADWVSFKQQFFNATIFGKGLFSRGSVKADFAKEETNYVKKYDATLYMDYHAAPTVHIQ